MDSLKSTHRTQQRANTSGAGSIRWPYFTMLRDLIGNQTECRPLVTASVGIQNTYRKRSMQEKENGSGPVDIQTPSCGRLNHPPAETSLRRQNSAAPKTPRVFRSPMSEMRQQQLEIQRQFLDQFSAMREQVARRNDLLADRRARLIEITNTVSPGGGSSSSAGMHSTQAGW